MVINMICYGFFHWLTMDVVRLRSSTLTLFQSISGGLSWAEAVDPLMPMGSLAGTRSDRKKGVKKWGKSGKIGGKLEVKFWNPMGFSGKSWESEEKHETSIGFDTDLVNKNGGLWGNVHGFSWNGGLNICNRRITCINMCKQNNEEVFSKKISGSNMFQHINIRISILPSRKEHHGEKRGNITCNEDT